MTDNKKRCVEQREIAKILFTPGAYAVFDFFIMAKISIIKPAMISIGAIVILVVL